MMAKSTSAALLARFISDTGTNPRTARHYRATNNPLWMEWLTVNGTIDVELPAERPLAEPAVVVSSDPVEIAREVERLALSTLRECGRQKALATQARKPELIVGWTTAEIQSQKLYSNALASRERQEQKTGRTMQAAQVVKERIEFAAAIRELFRAQPAEVGPQANPSNPSLAIRAIERWFAEKLQPALMSLQDGQNFVGASPVGGRGEEEPSPQLSLS